MHNLDLWTCFHYPLLSGENNLPLRIQLVGDKLDDLRFLGTANWLEKSARLMSKLTTIIGCSVAIAFLVGLATTLTRSSMIGFRCITCLYFNGLSNLMILYEAF